MKQVLMVGVCVCAAAAAGAQSLGELKARVGALEERVAKLEARVEPAVKQASKEEIVAEQRGLAKTRMRQDLEVYSREDLGKIEKLYQVANKQWRSEEGKASLKELIATYGKANRTGCALLYLGQMSTGEDQLDYLKKAIEGFSDCFYGNGVQVGAYARLYLAYRYKKDGQADKAAALFKEIGELYPHAIDHRGNLLSAIIEKEQK